jgi:hypothetical protein
MNWTKSDFRAVNIATFVNGLWLGLVAWLILGLWLDLVGFIPAWIGATFVCYIVAILRQGRVIEARGPFEES